MGFWDVAGKVAVGAGLLTFEVGKGAIKLVTAVGKDVLESNQKYKEEMISKSDDELVKIMQTGSGLRKTAAFTELKGRGHGPDDIKAMAGMTGLKPEAKATAEKTETLEEVIIKPKTFEKATKSEFFKESTKADPSHYCS